MAGSWSKLAKGMGIGHEAIIAAANGRKPVTADMAIRLAKALGVPFDSLVTPGVRVVRDPCPTCGGSAA